MEDVEVLELLTGRREQDRLAGDLADAQRGTTAGVAVELGEHDTGEADTRLERLRGVHRVLADHGVEHEDRLVGLDGVADARGLRHQLLVDAEAAGGVDDHDVVLLVAGLFDTGARDLDGVGGRDTERVLATADGGAGVRREHGRAGALTDDLQLADGAGTLEVTRDEQRRVALILQPLGQLAGEGGLTGALQTGQHDHGRRRLRELQASRLTTEDADEFLVDDLDDLLRRVERGRDLGALRALLDLGDEGADDGERDVGLEERETDLAARGVDVGSGESTLATQILEGSGQPVGKGFEHRMRS